MMLLGHMPYRSSCISAVTPISIIVGCIATLQFIVGLGTSARGDEVYVWHRMQLYCSASENVAALLSEGTWEGGELEPPEGVARLALPLERKDEGTCKLPDGRLVQVTQKQSPYHNGRCGSDPGVMFSLYINGAPVFQDRDFYDCHWGYRVLAIVLRDNMLKSCMWLDRTNQNQQTSITYFSDYQCRDDSDLLAASPN